MADKKETARHKLPVGPVRAVIAAVGIFAAAQVLAVGLVAYYGVLQGRDDAAVLDWLGESVWAMFAVHALVGVISVLGVAAVLRFSRQNWRAIGLVRPKPRDALYAVIGYGYYLPLFIVVSIAASLLFPGLDFRQRQELGFDPTVAGAQLAAAFVSLVVLVPIYEEILTRGLLYSGLRSSLRFLPAALISSLLFAAAHLQWGSGAPLLWVAAIDTFVLSMVLSTLREKTGSLWSAIGLHAIKNGVAFTLLFVLRLG